ncbi:MAG: hypothetical protein JWR19_1459, partial [Pedosphaera sp.]|nr:hypothetical protein [Pedosphaera sp.]
PPNLLRKRLQSSLQEKQHTKSRRSAVLSSAFFAKRQRRRAVALEHWLKYPSRERDRLTWRWCWWFPCAVYSKIGRRGQTSSKGHTNLKKSPPKSPLARFSGMLRDTYELLKSVQFLSNSTNDGQGCLGMMPCILTTDQKVPGSTPGGCTTSSLPLIGDYR